MGNHRKEGNTSMDTNTLYILAGILLLCALIVLWYDGLILINRKLIISGKHPELVRWVSAAITTAYKASDYVFDYTSDRLHCLEKQQIIKYMYDMLPDSINLYPLPFQLPWKRWVNKEQFIVIVEAQYDRMVVAFDQVRDNVLKQMLDDIQPNRLGVAKK